MAQTQILKCSMLILIAILLPISHHSGCSNPPAVWNYVRDIGKDWKNLAIFLGYSDSLISEIDSKSPHDVKSQIRNFMRVCLIPDCGEHRTEEIMDMIEVAMRPESQSKLCIILALKLG